MLTGNETLKDISLDQLKEYLHEEEEKARWSVYTEERPEHADRGTVWVKRNGYDQLDVQFGFNPKQPNQILVCHPNATWQKCPIEVFAKFVKEVFHDELKTL